MAYLPSNCAFQDMMLRITEMFSAVGAIENGFIPVGSPPAMRK